jgi:hypothetical protein
MPDAGTLPLGRRPAHCRSEDNAGMSRGTRGQVGSPIPFPGVNVAGGDSPQASVRPDPLAGFDEGSPLSSSSSSSPGSTRG